MGNTPSKKSSVGETVISNMEKWGNAPTDYIIRDSKGKAVMFKSLKDGGWYSIDKADMSHKNAEFEIQLKNATGKIESGHKDAVEYWNTCGKYTGARSKEVRAYMQNPDNYYLEVSNYNRSSGGKIKNPDGTRMTYDKPVNSNCKKKSGG